MNEKLVFTALIGFIILGVALIAIFAFPPSTTAQGSLALQNGHELSMQFTAFDKELAARLMDSDNDSKCDVCGMAIADCIASNMLQCNMDSKATIGLLGSAHAHAEFKVYANGVALDFSQYAEAHESAMSDPNTKITSSFIHVHDEEPAEKTGSILHMHASGIPLWVFFRSIGMKFDKNCLELDTNEQFCSNESKTLKFYVNGKQNNSFEDYAPKDDDKILISYGNESKEEIKGQLDSV